MGPQRPWEGGDILVPYESVFILRPDLDEERTGGLLNRVKAIVEDAGGRMVKMDRWGKRRLAYEIKHLREGYYVVVHFDAPPAAAKELDRVFRITDEVLRHIIVRREMN